VIAFFLSCTDILSLVKDAVFFIWTGGAYLLFL